MVAVAFDTLKLARRLRDDAHMSTEQAEGVADALAEAMSGAELATKPDIRELGQTTQAEFQTVRAEAREFEQAMKAEFQAVRAEAREFEQAMKAEFQAVRAEAREFEQAMKAEFRAVRAEAREFEQAVKAEFQAVRAEAREMELRLLARFDALNERIERRSAESDSRMVRWVLGVGATATLTIIGTAWTIIHSLPGH